MGFVLKLPKSKQPARQRLLVERHDRTSVGSVTRGGDNWNSSSILDSIPLAGGDNSSGDFGYYRTETVTLGLRMLGVSRGLPGWVPVV